MSVVFLDRWDLLQKCSQFIADFLFKTFSSDDDQWLIHNTILEIEALRIPPKPKPWENPFIVSWYVENSLRSLDGLIDDKILEGCRVADGNFRKLQAVVQLLENRSKPDHFVKQSAGSLEETKRTFVELNKCIKGQIASKLEEDLRRSIGTNSDHLFKTLVQNSTCCDKTGLHHVAKLQLVSSETLHPANNNGEPVYSYIVFLGTTSKQGPEPWHQLTFHFNSDDSKEDQLDFTENSRLCDWLGMCKDEKRWLKINCTNFDNTSTAKILSLERQIIPDKSAFPDVTLANLIDQHVLSGIPTKGKFVPHDRSVLLLTLAYSLLHLWRGNWLRNVWRAEDIYFLRTPSPSGYWIKQIDRPYLSARIMSDVRSETQARVLPCNDPCLLSFARLMLEIHTGGRINEEPITVSMVNHKLKDRYSSITQNFKAAVTACMNSELQVRQTRGKNTEEKVKNFILGNIIKPLHKDYSHWPPLENSSHEVELDSGVHQQMRPVGTPGTQLYDDDTTEPAEHTINNAKAYLRDFHSFNQRFIEHLRGRDSKNFPERLQNPIRVAVIDSGVSENDPKISAAIEQKRIVERKNWTESSYNDTYGHGTHVAKLFLTVAPNAKLYIAKVSENNKYILDTNLPTLGKAIDYAIDKWDVDIISISLGLDKSEPNIDAALDKALRPRGSNNRSYEKIVFAAASNEGARRACAFPARKPGVIRVNASDGNGGDIQRLSPGVDPNTENFVTLGINILSRWQGTDTLISGTSFATPIAAAIAADILELARFEVDIGVVEQRWLYSSKGMRAALKRYAEKVPGYRFLRPLESPEAVVQKLKEVLAVDFYV